MQFRRHDTFYIRKGWINKGIKNLKKHDDLFSNKELYPTDLLGIGANMVKALRYWLQAIDLTEETSIKGKRHQVLTDFGKLVYQHDPYTEELGTLYLLHYKLASNKEKATSWHYFFNVFNMSSGFTRDDFVNDIDNSLKIEGVSVAKRSLEDDFNCIINTYIKHDRTTKKKDSPENINDCPLSELGLIDIVSNGKERVFKKSSPAIETINPWIALSVLMDQIEENTQEISFTDLLNNENSIGHIFNLTNINLIDLLHKMEKTNAVKIIRTAGLDVVHINKYYPFIKCVENYYKELERNELGV